MELFGMHDEWVVEKAGPFWSLWHKGRYVDCYETKTEAMDAIVGWNRKLWSWKSLWDVEAEEK